MNILPVGMGDIEILYYMYDNHPLKYDDYCKYRDIYLIGYNIAVKTKLQAYSINLYHMSMLMFSGCILFNLCDIDNNITIMVAISV